MPSPAGAARKKCTSPAYSALPLASVFPRGARALAAVDSSVAPSLTREKVRPPPAAAVTRKLPLVSAPGPSSGAVGAHAGGSDSACSGPSPGGAS